jgi:hypothetical protein
MIPTAIGQHRVSRRDDIVHMTFVGPLTRADVEGMREVVGAVLAEGSRLFLVGDLRGCTAIEAGARQYFAEWSKNGGQKPSGVVIYGLDFAMRTIISLTLSAIKFLGRQQTEVVFAKDEAEALRWVTDERAARDRQAS